MEKKIYRLLDANYNRAREGMRVCEDVLRFKESQADQALKLKGIRHSLAELMNEFELQKLLKARDVERDEMRFVFQAEEKKISFQDLLRRNFKRASEALRVLEEVSLLIKPELRKKFMKLRFELYQVERNVLLK